MSLLIPTAQDKKDAYAGYERLPIYQERLEQRKNEKTADGKPVFKYEFSVVPGFFKQSDLETDDFEFRYATEDFGVQKPWEQVAKEIHDLNEHSDANTKYKLVFLARHGQGYHNIIVLKYGSAEWRRKWHNIAQDGDIVYGPDPELTEIGINQGKQNHEAWEAQLSKGCPLPTKYIVLPLQRSCNTLLLTMDGLWPQGTKVLILEQVREIIGFHLCNKRSTKTQILEKFGKYGFETEPGFVEEDELHTEEEELFDDMCFRLNIFLQRLFEEDDEVVNMTSHGGVIKCVLAVLGHRPFTISTGGMIPVVIKATKSDA